MDTCAGAHLAWSRIDHAAPASEREQGAAAGALPEKNHTARARGACVCVRVCVCVLAREVPRAVESEALLHSCGVQAHQEAGNGANATTVFFGALSLEHYLL